MRHFRFLISLFVALLALSASAVVFAADTSARPLHWRDVRDDPVSREQFLEQRREQRERMRMLRQELRREVDAASANAPARVVEPRAWREVRAQDTQIDPDRGARPRRLSPEERERLREDMREVWREPRVRR